MRLELLPNELLLEIFKFLSTVDLLRAFYELNNRFNDLLVKHIQYHKYIDLQSTSKYNFDFFWKQYLSKWTDQITSLSFSDGNNTPDQMDQFYTYGFTLCQFTCLQSLSLSHIHSVKTMNRIMKDLPHLSTLTHLTFEKCYLDYGQVNASSLVNIIWSLPNLVYYRLNMYFGSTLACCLPTVTSSTIKYVDGFRNEQGEGIGHLFKYTPRIRCLSIHIAEFPSFTDLSTNVISITKLNLLFASSIFSPLLDFLRRIPNLSHLKLDMSYHGIHAQIWEGLIHKDLTKLKSLQFKMNFIAGAKKDDREKQTEQILDSFRNSFWLVEHRWFVQCDWSSVSEQCYVYTLPYTFENFNIDFPISSKSTCAPDNHPCFYDRVHRLTYRSASYLYECLTLSHIKFSNVEHITIDLPKSNHFRYKNKWLDQSASVSVPLTDDCETNCLNQLQLLLAQHPRLTSLHIREWPLAILNLSHYKIKNVSVSELNLRCNSSYEYYYTEEQCAEFSRSILGIQCKILTIDVENQTCVRDLIINMNNLQVLNVRCQRIKRKLHGTSTEEDLVGWLHENLQSVSTDIKNITCRRVKGEKHLFIERS